MATASLPEYDYVTTREVARALRFKSIRSVQLMVERGELEAVRRGQALLIPRSEVERYIAARTVNATGDAA